MTEIGEIVGPVPSQFGYHIIQVHEREVRELTETEMDAKRQTAFSEWLTGLRDEAGVQYPVSYVDRTPDDPTIFDMGLAGAVSGS